MRDGLFYYASLSSQGLSMWSSADCRSFRYVGPIQGHRVDLLLETFDNVKQMIANGEGPILVHAITAKGYGYEPAQQDPFKYHGVGAFEVESVSTASSACSRTGSTTWASPSSTR